MKLGKPSRLLAAVLAPLVCVSIAAPARAQVQGAISERWKAAYAEDPTLNLLDQGSVITSRAHTPATDPPSADVYVAGTLSYSSGWKALVVLNYQIGEGLTATTPTAVGYWAGITSPGFYSVRGIALSDSSNSVYITGDAPGPSSGRDIITICFNADNLVQMFMDRFNGDYWGDDSPSAMSVEAGRVAVVGTSQFSATGTDYVTILYNEDLAKPFKPRFSWSVAAASATPMPTMTSG